MFREIILPIYRSTRLCVTVCGIMNPRCCRPATGWQHRGCIIPQAVTQSSTPEDGRNNCPKHVELTGIINKPLLLHLVDCLYYLHFIIFCYTISIYSSTKCRVFHYVTFLVRKIFTFYINDVLLLKCPLPGSKD